MDSGYNSSFWMRGSFVCIHASHTWSSIINVQFSLKATTTQASTRFEPASQVPGLVQS